MSAWRRLCAIFLGAKSSQLLCFDSCADAEWVEIQTVSNTADSALAKEMLFLTTVFNLLTLRFLRILIFTIVWIFVALGNDFGCLRFRLHLVVASLSRDIIRRIWAF